MIRLGFLGLKIVSEYDQEIPQSQTVDRAGNQTEKGSLPDWNLRQLKEGNLPDATKVLAG